MDPWNSFLEILHGNKDWVVDFVHRQGIQTNETQRCFALLPLFLTIARTVGKPLDLLELGASAGLNLLWDCYHYRYREGTWGSPDARLALTGEEIDPVPAELLTQEVVVNRRRGIDLNPVDVTTGDGFRLLASFVGADTGRVDRLRQAAAVLRGNPPELIRGDYLEILPHLLRERDDDKSVTVVFQTISTIYLPMEQRIQLRDVVEAFGKQRGLAWISTPTPEEHGQRRGDYPIELSIWPPGKRRIVARMTNSGDSLEWIG